MVWKLLKDFQVSHFQKYYPQMSCWENELYRLILVMTLIAILQHAYSFSIHTECCHEEPALILAFWESVQSLDGHRNIMKALEKHIYVSLWHRLLKRHSEYITFKANCSLKYILEVSLDKDEAFYYTSINIKSVSWFAFDSISLCLTSAAVFINIIPPHYCCK